MTHPVHQAYVRLDQTGGIVSASPDYSEAVRFTTREELEYWLVQNAPARLGMRKDMER